MLQKSWEDRSIRLARGIEAITKSSGFDHSLGQTDAAGTGRPIAMGVGEVAPPDVLPHRADTDDLITADRPGNNQLESKRVRHLHEPPDGPAHGRLEVSAIVMAHPGPFAGLKAKIDGHHRSLSPPLQLSEPLVSRKVVGQDWHAENTSGYAIAAGDLPDPGPSDRTSILLRSQMGEEWHEFPTFKGGPEGRFTSVC